MHDNYNQNIKEIEDEELVITLNNENGDSIDCTVLTTFVSQGHDYIALLPHDEKFQIHIFRYKMITNNENEEEGIEIMNIYSDMEYEAALKVFQSLIEDYEEPVSEEENMGQR